VSTEQAVDGVIGVLQPKLDPDLAGLGLIQDRLDLIGQAGEEMRLYALKWGAGGS
jgi:hypothetical protein